MTEAVPSHRAWSDVSAERVFPGVVRQVVHGRRQTLVRYVYEPGAVFPVHSHPEEQITVVVSGRLAFEIDGRRVELGSGHVAVIPAGVPHGARVVGDETVETYNALSPRRQASPFAATTE